MLRPQFLICLPSLLLRGSLDDIVSFSDPIYSLPLEEAKAFENFEQPIGIQNL